jgi:hypothetical protein
MTMEARIVADPKGASICDPAPFVRAARVAPDFGTRFSLFIDTEEDFDWGAPFSRSGFGLESVANLAVCQSYFEDAGVQPLYLVDYPIVQSDLAIEILAPCAAAGKCDIGVQLHPWVSPPFDEDVSTLNSFAGNLPEELERAKIFGLRDAIIERFCVTPITYRAGRYGLGPNSMRLIAAAGLKIDTSVRSRFSYTHEGGPNYAQSPVTPYWTGEGGQVLELPLTTVIAGWLRNIGLSQRSNLAQRASRTALWSRIGAAERIALTPEGIPSDKACAGIDVAIEKGLPLLNFSFHSPSLMAGHTPYVRSDADLRAFYVWWDVVLNHLAKRGVRPASQADIVSAFS